MTHDLTYDASGKVSLFGIIRGHLPDAGAGDRPPSSLTSVRSLLLIRIGTVTVIIRNRKSIATRDRKSVV